MSSKIIILEDKNDYRRKLMKLGIVRFYNRDILVWDDFRDQFNFCKCILWFWWTKTLLKILFFFFSLTLYLHHCSVFPRISHVFLLALLISLQWLFILTHGICLACFREIFLACLYFFSFFSLFLFFFLPFWNYFSLKLS